MPSEYCEFGVPAVYEKCKKWMADNAPEYLPAPPPSEKGRLSLMESMSYHAQLQMPLPNK